MLYKSAASGMAGCCASDTQNCGWSNSCIDYMKYIAGSCGTSCLADPFVRVCSNAAAPYCVTWTYPADDIADYGCAATSRNTVYTIRSTASDGLGGTTSIRLSTVSGKAVTSATDTPYTYTGGSGTRKTTKKKKLTIGAIIGIVIAVLGLLFVIAVVAMMFLKKKKKQNQLAQNAQIMAANQSQQQYQQPPPPQEQIQMQQPGAGFQGSPPPANNAYYPPQQENKFNGHHSVSEYVVSPISNPATPAPAYGQPNGTQGVPPMPQQEVRGYHMPVGGAQEVAAAGVTRPHEVDATSVPHASPPNGTGPGLVYEIGHGRG
jgi:type II secretory pathway pseudopilin PulG